MDHHFVRLTVHQQDEPLAIRTDLVGAVEPCEGGSRVWAGKDRHYQVMETPTQVLRAVAEAEDNAIDNVRELVHEAIAVFERIVVPDGARARAVQVMPGNDADAKWADWQDDTDDNLAVECYSLHYAEGLRAAVMRVWKISLPDGAFAHVATLAEAKATAENAVACDPSLPPIPEP